MKKEHGFTLIELLVVIAIIGILAAIAIPQFAEYKTRAFNSRAQTDLRNGLTAEEAYFVDHEKYVSCTGTNCTSGTTKLPGFVISDGVQVAFAANAAGDKYAGGSCHARGDKAYAWASDTNVMGNSASASCSAAPTVTAP